MRDAASRQAVYNIEVEGDHVYRVGHDGILVHNRSVLCEVGDVSVRHGHNRFAHQIFHGYEEVTFKVEYLGTEELRRLDHFVEGTGVGFEVNTTPWSKMNYWELERKLAQAQTDYELVQLAKRGPVAASRLREFNIRQIVWLGTEKLPKTGDAAKLRWILKASGIKYYHGTATEIRRLLLSKGLI